MAFIVDICSSALINMVSDLMSLAVPAQVITPSMMDVVNMPGFENVARMINVGINGMVRKKVVIDIKIASVFPPAQPAAMPIRTDVNMDINPAKKPTSKEDLAPNISSLKIS